MTLPSAGIRDNGAVIVLGSVNVDLIVSTARLPKAGETVQGLDLVRQLGGKGANQAVGAVKAGMACTLLAAVGSDAEGAAMIATLRGYGVDVSKMISVEASTGTAFVATSPTDNQIIVVAGANSKVDVRLATSVKIMPSDVCVTQMETPVTAAKAFFGMAKAAGATTVLNAAPASAAARGLLPLCDILVVNEAELFFLAGADEGLSDAALISYKDRMRMGGGQVLIATMGADGLAIVRSGSVLRIPAHRVDVVDTTGAGDCFCGYLAAGLARGSCPGTAAIEANAASSIAVQMLGAAASIPVRSAVLEKLDQCSA
jgi:ribokinase